MLEQADQSGRLDPDDFDEQTIIDPSGKAGYYYVTLMLIVILMHSIT